MLDIGGDKAAIEEALRQGRPRGAFVSKRYGYRSIKRAFDVAFSAAVIAAGFVPGAILAIAVTRDTGGSPIYAQDRVGRSGKVFRLYKFRTMVADADNLEKYLNSEQLAQWHSEHKVDVDPRITKLGSFLRKTSIDEFPQFINSLFGQMSVVGPRAITVEELRWFGDDTSELLSVRPGITGLWQTGERNKATFESGLRQDLELLYVRNCGLKTDMRIVFRTLRTMVEGTGK